MIEVLNQIFPILLWSLEKREYLIELKSTNGSSFAFSSNGKVIAAGSDSTVKLWSSETGQEIDNLIGHSDRVYSVASSIDGRFLASGSESGLVILWNAVTRKKIRNFESFSFDVT